MESEKNILKKLHINTLNCGISKTRNFKKKLRCAHDITSPLVLPMVLSMEFYKYIRSTPILYTIKSKKADAILDFKEHPTHLNSKILGCN